MTRIKVKVGNSEAEVEADPEHLREAIDLVPELASKLPSPAQGTTPASKARVAEQAQDSPNSPRPNEVPMVSLEKNDSLSDVIEKFFADSWGRDGRKLSDVRVALQTYGLNYPKQSVAVALLRLAKTTKVRRFKAADGEFVYTSSGVSMSAPPMAPSEGEADELALPQPN
ncbi:MAG: hypothetical protein HY297_06190 [Thaumarchaeota archaeon]|nr:hypothetical protein [Nitrososphaerota archaeon]